MPLAIVISYSSNESQFLRPQLDQVLRCADQVVYSIGSHLYDMTPEEDAVFAGDKVTVVRYDVSADVAENPRKYHNLARETGVAALRKEIEWVLFLDADEIPEGLAFDVWFRENSGRLSSKMSYKFACHWYFVHPTWRARADEDSIVLVHRDQLTADALRDPAERDGIVRRCPGGCMRGLKSRDDEKLFHHFSWVRSKSQALHKVSTWGHRADRLDWATFVENAWSASSPPSEGDFVHGYLYDIVEDKFAI